MRIYFYLIMGVVNSLIGLTIFVNKNLWASIQTREFLTFSGFFSVLPQVLMPITSILFAYYCFSIKARGDERYWKINFVLNAVLFVLLTASVIYAEVELLSGTKFAANILVMIAPLALISVFNLRLLFYRLPTKNGFESNAAHIN